MDILVGVSNRHVHLTREDLDTFFGEGYELTVKNYLVQPGQFACNETVSLEANGYRKDYVRIIGPIRKYTQVELLDSDKELFKLDPPVRNSGELDNSESIKDNNFINLKDNIYYSKEYIKEYKDECILNK